MTTAHAHARPGPAGRLVLAAPDHHGRRAPKLLGRADAAPVAGMPIRLPVPDARHHLQVLGVTGTGKSTELLALMLAEAAAGRGFALLDPKGDLARDMLARLPASAGRRLVLVDPDETDAPAALNVLDTAGRSPELVTEHVVGVLHRLYGAYWGPRVEDTLRAAILTLTTHHAGATLADVPRLLTDRRFRTRLAGPARAGDPDGLGAFWDAFDALTPAAAAAACGPVLSKLRAVLTRPFAADLFGTATSTFDPREILDGGILIARLPKGVIGEDGSRLVGSLLLAALWQAALARADQPEQGRLDASVIVDECHNFLHLPIGIDDALAEARGCGCRSCWPTNTWANCPPRCGMRCSPTPATSWCSPCPRTTPAAWPNTSARCSRRRTCTAGPLTLPASGWSGAGRTPAGSPSPPHPRPRPYPAGPSGCARRPVHAACPGRCGRTGGWPADCPHQTPRPRQRNRRRPDKTIDKAAGRGAVGVAAWSAPWVAAWAATQSCRPGCRPRQGRTRSPAAPPARPPTDRTGRYDQPVWLRSGVCRPAAGGQPVPG
jgi:hypothetical protein